MHAAPRATKRAGAELLPLVYEELRRLAAHKLAGESPGLVTGLAGIGYGLLGVAEPDKVPCVLALAPPNVAAPMAAMATAGKVGLEPVR